MKEEIKESIWEPNPEWERAQFVFMSEFRACEDKLNAANERIDQIEQELNALRAEEARLLNTNEELERHIKQLEIKQE